MKRLCHTFLLALVMPVSSSLADTILLTNGNTIEGIVSSETDESVVLDLGVGTMKIRKSRIKELTRSDPAQIREIEADWKKKHILHSRHIPEGLERLAKEFRNLEAARASVGKAAAAQSELRRKIDRTKQEIKDLHEEHVRVNDALQWIDPKADTAKYNSFVAKNNTISSSLSLKYADLERAHKQAADCEKSMAAYLKTLDAFDHLFTAASNDRELASMTSGHEVFFEEMAARLAPYKKEYRSHQIITANRGMSTLVPVIINNTQPATLVLDTGASAVTISRELAAKLGLDLESAKEVKVTLADGKSVSAHEVLLESVAAGQAVANGVEALVLQEPPAEGIDGLLGMTFLGRFHMKLDGGAGTLKLDELELGSQ